MDVQHVFIYSSVDGYLGCYHLLTIVASAATNMGVKSSVPLLSIFLCLYVDVELLDQMVIL